MNAQGEIDTLKVVNLMFAEREKLAIENPLLKTKIKSLEDLNSLYVITDSIQKEEITIYKDRINKDAQKIKKLKTSKKKIIGYSSIGGIILFITGLLI